MMRVTNTILAGMALVPSALGANLIASHFSGQLYSISFTSSGSTGKLAITGQATGCGSTPGWIELYDAKTLYCFDESWMGSGYIAQYNVGSDGKLSMTAQTRTGGNSVHGTLYGGADGRGFAATAEYSPSTITTYRLPLSGAQRLQQEKFTMAQRGPNARQDVPHPHEVGLDPTGKFILVPDLGADLVRIFKIDASTGRLTNCGNGQASRGDGPRHAKWWKSADGVQRLYTLNELGNSVSSWNVQYPTDASGCLSITRAQTISTYAPGKKGGATTKAAEIRVVGNFLYASNRADQTFGSQQDSIAIYTIDAKTGDIAWMEAANSYSYYPRTFQFNKEGTLAAVGGQTSSNVAIISRDPATGKLGSLVATLQVGSKGRAGEEDGLSGVVWVE